MKQPPFLLLKSLVFFTLLLCAITTNSFSQTFVGASSTPSDNSSQAGPTVVVAPPGSMQAGDLVIIYTHYRSTPATLSMSATGGQTWSTTTSLSNNNQSMAVFWCRYNGSWGTSPSVSVGTGTAGMSVIMYVFRPTSSTKSWAVNASTAATTSNNGTVSITGHTTTLPNTVTMAFWSSPAANTWGTLTSGWTKPGSTQYRNTQTTSNQSHTAAYKINATAGSTGNVQQTQTNTQQTKTYMISWAEVDVSDDCNNAISLTPGTSCTTVLGSLNGATYTSGGGVPGCGAANLDVWYKFVAQSSNPVITTTLASGSGQRRTELYEGSCGSLNSLGCSGNSNTLNATGLTYGQTYYVRVYSNDTNPYDFTICVQDQAAANGTCATAATLTPSTSCTPVSGDMFLSNQTNPTGGCGNYYDVWYKFTAPASYSFANISVTPTGSPSALDASNTFVELFKSNCGSLNNNSLGCSSIGSVRNMAILSGTTYYFRIYTTSNPNVYGSSYTFDICITLSNSVTSSGGRMGEVFKQTILSPPSVLADPWEVTYGPDDSLWITESKGYKVYRMSPVTGTKETVLDISQGSTFLPLADQVFNCQFNNGNGAQGGLAGLALHPKFLDPVSPVNYVYISYVYKLDSASVLNSSCTFFKNRLVRFTFNTATHQLESPVSLCDTLPGGNDHNSQRIIIAPITPGGTKYLFYAQGDLGAGQLVCRDRVQKAQMINSYEGKILRFNLDTDGDSPTLSDLDNWIPNDNPYSSLVGKQSAVWSIGIRNNQGFAYDTALNILYGSSHGPYSDDEINIIEPFRNYGHPLVIGYASDGNYNGTTTPGLNTSVSAGVPYTDNTGISANPPIGDEMANKAIIDANGHGLYKDPLFSAYAAPNGDITTAGTVKYIWKNNPGNASPAPGWPSEAWSGLDLYTNSKIPGWKKSLVAASLKWGRLVRIKLATSGTITVPSNDPINNAGDTISYFGSQNRFRDLAFAPNGKDIYVVMDRSTTTSGPSAQWPVVPACQGCVQKYSFLGYNVNAGNQNRSYISTTVDIASGLNNNCDTGNTVTINAANENTNLWVPITDNNSNVIAEIYAQGQDLGNVTTSFYHNANAVRTKSGKKYLDRNITITPQTQPAGDVKVRLYITEAEYQALKNSSGSAIANPGDVKLFKNNDVCGSAMSATLNTVSMDFNAETFGSGGYVLQGTISSFSTFYFGANSLLTLPLDLITFTGSLQNDNSVLLKWKTENERNTSSFEIERSAGGSRFTNIGVVNANNANGNIISNYSFFDRDASGQQSAILYYRLKIVDIDGSFNYSNVVAIPFNPVADKIKISPNPTTGVVNISLPSSINEKIHWKLVDNTGRVLLQNTTQLRVGNNSWMIDISKLTSGTYYLNVSGSGIDRKIKIQKL